MGTIIMKAVKSPIDAVCSRIVFNPPNQMTAPRVTDDNKSAIGKNTELYHTVLIHPFL